MAERSVALDEDEEEELAGVVSEAMGVGTSSSSWTAAAAGLEDVDWNSLLVASDEGGRATTGFEEAAAIYIRGMAGKGSRVG